MESVSPSKTLLHEEHCFRECTLPWRAFFLQEHFSMKMFQGVLTFIKSNLPWRVFILREHFSMKSSVQEECTLPWRAIFYREHSSLRTLFHEEVCSMKCTVPGCSLSIGFRGVLFQSKCSVQGHHCSRECTVSVSARFQESSLSMRRTIPGSECTIFLENKVVFLMSVLFFCRQFHVLFQGSFLYIGSNKMYNSGYSNSV